MSKLIIESKYRSAYYIIVVAAFKTVVKLRYKQIFFFFLQPSRIDIFLRVNP